ncbi:outer membrane protein assembly factor BamE [bacterium BD-1]|nr:outer membrane protein assembly factor BamE [Ottowia caeni]
MMSAARTFGATMLLAVAAILVGCAANPEKIAAGTPRAQVLEALGSPTARYPLADGERLQYSMQPAGQLVYNVDFDATGRLVRAEQVLNEGLFPQRIVPNRWTRDEILREYGPPARTEGVHNFKGRIWVWRYADGPVWRLLFIDVDPQGIVRGYSVGDEPMPEPHEPAR